MGYSAEVPYAIVAERTFISRVYGWMTAGLVLTAVVAMLTMTTGLYKTIFTSPLFLILILAELGLVFFLSAAVHKISPAAAGAAFIVYSALNGLTLSVVFLVYQLGSISSVFFVTAATFGTMSIYGHMTKRDLTSIGNLAMMGLFGIVIAMIVNLFVGSQKLDYIISIVGVLVFVGLVAYDTQKIKMIHQQGSEGTDTDKRLAIMGALALYLDFINLFLMLLRLLGRRK